MLKNLARSVFALPLLLAVALLLAPVPAHPLDLSLDGNLRLQCDTVTATGTGTAGTATLANKCGVVTTEAINSPTSSNYALTLTNTVAAAADLVLWSVETGTATSGIAQPGVVVTTANTIVFNVRQMSATSFNGGTLKIKYLVIKP